MTDQDDDPTPAAGAILPAADQTPLIPAQFGFKGAKKRPRKVAAASALVGTEEAESRSAGAGKRVVHVVGPKTEAAEAAGIIEADFPDGIIAPLRTKRATVAKWAALRVTEPNLTNIEIAQRLGISVISLNGYISLGRKEGWLRFEDPLARMEYEIVPKAVAGLSELLDRKDKTAIIETAKGTLYPMYRESKGVVEQQQTVLALKIERADGENMKVITGHIVGKPKISVEQD